MDTKTETPNTPKQFFGKMEPNKVHKTKQYGLFTHYKENRAIHQNHVNKLIKSMKERGWIPGSHIIVNKSGRVVDGQHRLKAAMAVGIPVEYIVSPKATMTEVINLNRGKMNWNIIAFLDHHVTRGNKNYIALKKFLEDYPKLRPTEAMMLLSNKFSSAKRGAFEDGEWKMGSDKVAREWADNVMSLEPYFDGYNRSIFVRALIKIFVNKPEFVFSEFLHKVKLRPQMIYKCGTVDSYLMMIEELYNYRRRNAEKLNLRF